MPHLSKNRFTIAFWVGSLISRYTKNERTDTGDDT